MGNNLELSLKEKVLDLFLRNLKCPLLKNPFLFKFATVATDAYRCLHMSLQSDRMRFMIFKIFKLLECVMALLCSMIS